MLHIKKEFLANLISHINRKDWWHVPPLDAKAYQKPGKFLASSFAEAELYGRPLDLPQKVTITNPLIGDEPTVCRVCLSRLFPFLNLATAPS